MQYLVPHLDNTLRIKGLCLQGEKNAAERNDGVSSSNQVKFLTVRSGVKHVCSNCLGLGSYRLCLLSAGCLENNVAPLSQPSLYRPIWHAMFSLKSTQFTVALFLQNFVFLPRLWRAGKGGGQTNIKHHQQTTSKLQWEYIQISGSQLLGHGSILRGSQWGKQF